MKARVLILVLVGGVVIGMGANWVYLNAAGQEAPPADEKKAAPEMPPMPPRPEAELKALDSLVGSWKDEMTAKPCAMMPEGLQATGMVTSEWVLDGWFVMSKYKCAASTMGPYEGIGLMTYDPQKKAYRNWWFSSMGEAAEQTGQFDPASKTFTFTGVNPMTNNACHSTMKVVDADTVEWSGVEKAPDGSIAMEMTSKSTRVR